MLRPEVREEGEEYEIGTRSKHRAMGYRLCNGFTHCSLFVGLLGIVSWLKGIAEDLGTDLSWYRGEQWRLLLDIDSRWIQGRCQQGYRL